MQSFDVIPEQNNWFKKRFGNKKSNTVKSVKLPKKKLSAPAVASLYPAKNNVHEFRCGVDTGEQGVVGRYVYICALGVAADFAMLQGLF